MYDLNLFMKMKYSHEAQAIEVEQAICLFLVQCCVPLNTLKKYEKTNKMKFTYLHLIKNFPGISNLGRF